MTTESTKIIRRRAINKLLETGLLVLAVALGVGAAASGLSLLVNTLQFSDSMLTLPAYREIIVSTNSQADEMETAVQLKPVQETAVLTSADLKAAELIPDIAWAYISNRTRMNLVNESTAAREAQMRQQFSQGSGNAEVFVMEGTPGAGTSLVFDGPAGAIPGGDFPTDAVVLGADTAADGGTGGAEGVGNAGSAPDFPGGAGFPGRPGEQMIGSSELEAAKADDSIIIGEQEELNGWSVTEDFFPAWSVSAAAGSLFAPSDYTGTENQVVLGSSLAKTLAGQGSSPGDLVGRKILSREGYQNIIGILNPTGNDEYDDAFFEPYRSLAQRGFVSFRFGRDNTQIKFTVTDPTRLGSVSALLKTWFDDQYGMDQIVLNNPREEAQRLVSRNTGISILILFLSLAGLFIASVNVSNILMGRGLRMRKSVGILMALGADKRSILGLFVSEAVVLSAAGSVLGMILALPLSASMQQALGMQAGSVVYLVAGIAASWLLTLGFSVIPAIQNSRMNPADAMRVV